MGQDVRLIARRQSPTVIGVGAITDPRVVDHDGHAGTVQSVHRIVVNDLRLREFSVAIGDGLECRKWRLDPLNGVLVGERWYRRRPQLDEQPMDTCQHGSNHSAMPLRGGRTLHK